MKTFLLCATLAAIASPALAQPRPASVDPEIPRQTVRYDDLDLSRPAGADALIARIGRAARTVCGEQSVSEFDRTGNRRRACIAKAMSTAIAQVDAPIVTSRFYGPNQAIKLAGK
ncbi:MAG: UrcA family protein [Caulobacterales bacterium]|nr:UrcA family protein [Caulobacterales bacterium]